MEKKEGFKIKIIYKIWKTGEEVRKLNYSLNKTNKRETKRGILKLLILLNLKRKEKLWKTNQLNES